MVTKSNFYKHVVGIAAVCAMLASPLEIAQLVGEVK